MKTKLPIATGGALVVLCVGLILSFFTWLPEEVPFLYSMPWGDEVLVRKQWFALGSIIMGLMFGVDTGIGIILEKKDVVLGNVVIWFGVGVVAMYMAGVVKILMLML